MGITHCLAKFGQALQAQTDSSLRDTLVSMACGELETLSAKRHKKGSAETELQLLGAKLFLYGWSFDCRLENAHLDHSSPTTPFEPSVSKKFLLLGALSSAVQYIHAFSDLKPSETTITASIQSQDFPPQVYFPKFYMYTAYFSALTLYHFLATMPQASVPDQDLARNHIRLAHQVLSSCILDDTKSQWCRLAQNIELVGQFVNLGLRVPAEAHVQSRRGASLFYETTQKLAIVMAERGKKNWSSDLTQAPDVEGDRSKQEVIESGNRAKANNAPEAAVEGNAGELHVPQALDDNFWGWDISMMDPADWEMDWNGLDPWQP